MKKYGFTIVETIVSIFILTVLFSVGVSLSKLGRSLTNDIENTEYIYEIQNLFTYGKAVCSEKNKPGKIIINPSENKIYFIDAWDNIEKQKSIILPKEIKIFAEFKSMKIDGNGKIEPSNTIILLDKYGEKQKITIRVGVDLIVINDGNLI